MTAWEFICDLNRAVTDAEVGALYDAGFSDSAVETGPGGALIDVTREAPTRAEAVASAVAAIARIPGLAVTRIREAG